MARVPSDDESVASIRVDLARSGGTRRPCVRIPDDVDLPGRLESGTCESLSMEPDDLVRLVIDREERHARVESDSRGRLLRGAFDDRRRARTPGEGTDRLAEWLDAHDREPGDVVVLDVVVPNELYGLRIPGDRTMYDVKRGPPSSLADIARDLDGS
ncbi:hypothetical protein J2751_002601 [Halorubrum alkaliphilum]|uniref:Uncharacterized protein n=1 Tax=Halorubrum alkaliphilum TaxID=261290 RepID=A0A8T4GGC4_9EURY|nr:hypothetical protein [Halorubrum alkaliphilum]MBP1923558.1 hypothetical protein [Halorubrum alkaliphilum]